MTPDEIQLADYRRRVAQLYLSPPADGAAGALAFRAGREELFRTHPQSALDPGQRLRYFDYDDALRVPARLAPPTDDTELVIEMGGEDGAIRCRRVARLVFQYGELTLFWITGYGGGLFLPFRDATSGRETYGGGRYLVDTIKGTFGRALAMRGDEAVLDFNYAYNPSCCYDDRYVCPLAPRENWLAAPIRAGEQVPEIS